MTLLPAIEAAESRAVELRMTMAEVCAEANVHPSVWSRAKTRGRIRIKTLRKVEEALSQLERDRQAAA